MFRLASKLSVQLVRSSAAAGSKTRDRIRQRCQKRLEDRVEEVPEIGLWQEPPSRPAMAVAATNAPALSPTPDNSRRRALPACFFPLLSVISAIQKVGGTAQPQANDPECLSGFR